MPALLRGPRGLAVAGVALLALLHAGSGAAPRAALGAQLSFGARPASVPAAAWYWTMAVSPADPNVLLLGTSNGLYRSGDGGRTWRRVGPAQVDVTSVAEAGGSLYLGGVRVVPGADPVVEKGATRVVSDGRGVLATSSDAGASWRELHPRGLPDVAIQALAGDHAALYLLLNTGALYRSTDAADSFKLVSRKLGVAPWALVITGDDHFVAGGMDSGSSFSQNGKTWQRSDFSDANGGHMVMEYAAEPSDPTRVLMAAFGLELSNNDGRSWQVALRSNVMFGPVAWAPGVAGLAYAVGFDGSLWRTLDSGRRWSMVSR